MDRGPLTWIGIGIGIGVLARLSLLRRDPGGLITVVLLGMAGALFAGFLGRAADARAPAPAAAAGAVAALLSYHMALRRRS